jgi:hypothetical protein
MGATETWVQDSQVQKNGEDFRKILPVTNFVLKSKVFVEVPIAKFMVGGLTGKLLFNYCRKNVLRSVA